MKRVLDWFLALVVLLLGRGRPRPTKEDERIVPEGEPSTGAETLVIFLLLAAACTGIAFPVVYGLDLPNETQLLGTCIGLTFALLSAAMIVASKKLVVTEEVEEEYPAPGRVAEQEAVVQIVEESGSRLTRRRILFAAGGAAGGALGLALLTPVVSLGPVFDVEPFYGTPWRRGRRLVDERGRPYHADDIEEKDFYTAFPEGANKEDIGSAVVVVRLDPSRLQLPDGRGGWAPQGILAYSKICTHAACAIALYRTPTFQPVEPRPALVCPCHYSTFDPATGGSVIFGPAGRPLPQLPIMIDRKGGLRAGGNFSGPVGPSWWGVRMESAHP